jgi:E3 ubiquitin-protein ligase MYCBP2
VSCTRRHVCGHACGGVRNEGDCLPCLLPACGLKPSARGVKPSVDADELCNICWVESLAACPSVLLDCGHVFHYACIMRRIEGRWTTPRISFHFANCPLCKRPVSSPLLAAALKPVRDLFEVVKTKSLQRLTYERMEKDAIVAAPDGRYYGDLAGYALDVFAYFMCFKCKEPYFGGKRACGAAGGGEEHAGGAPPADAAGGAPPGAGAAFEAEHLVCGSCAGGAAASICAKHGKDYIDYKCRFCCSIASWYCWGTTHFCESCHTKQMNGDYVSRKPKSQLVKCKGASACPLKIDHPANGDEFSMGCSICRSDAVGF